MCPFKIIFRLSQIRGVKEKIVEAYTWYVETIFSHHDKVDGLNWNNLGELDYECDYKCEDR